MIFHTLIILYDTRVCNMMYDFSYVLKTIIYSFQVDKFVPGLTLGESGLCRWESNTIEHNVKVFK